VTAGAGVTIGDLQAHARATGRDYGVDLASRDSATVGGTIATNAGGVRVVSYGDTRRQVFGLEAVLADGSVVSHLSGLVKDNTGYDLAGLFTGSEGTLGIVTAARLRLVPRRPPGLVLLVGCSSVEEAVAMLPPAGVRAAELMLEAGVDLVCHATGLPPPLARRWPVYLLLETDEVPDLPDDVDAAVHARLWDYRERHTEAISTVGVPHKLDVSMPLAGVGEFLRRLADVVDGVDASYRTFVFGHIADGNLHVNVVGPAADDDTVDDAVFRLVASLGGSISAEHGVGVAKVPWLHLVRSDAEIVAMRRIKAALDPTGALNPGVLLP
jgi:FAD/FMN-containing dehydrogenase